MTVSLTGAQPPLDFLPPAFDPKVLWMIKTLLPTWMQWKSSIKRLEVNGTETLVDLFHQFHQDKVRFLIAFRHPSPDDAYCLMELLWHELPQVARKLGKPFSKTPHAHFVYDRGIPLWAGNGVGWLYSKLGGTPIQRGKIDRPGLKSVRHLFAQGAFPMAAAPEGANNGHTEIISPFEPGIAQFGFWCVEDLLKADRSEKVLIVPLGIQYKYRHAPWDRLTDLLTSLEHEAGLTPTSSDAFSLGGQREAATPVRVLYPRLVQLGMHLLALMETYYKDFYKASFEEPSAPEDDNNFAFRLNQLLDTALQVAEDFFHLSGKGTVIDRCRRIEQAGWDWIYREELRDQVNLSAVERGLADRVAEEAALRMWHMRLVESFVAVTGTYVSKKPTVERFAETLLLLRDTIVRIKGENPFPRPWLGNQAAYLSVGTPVSVSDRWPAYKQNRRQAISDLTADLQQSMQRLISTEGIIES
ncbi:MAG: 1-acyl-sn-glycerol-3-phosphate acyltransferase [Leptolyngbya sp. SIO1D8]|nr:1-acyl-sn-glycerol-3-phosphate acyltransferase [Leptolyngbya sp. SIO1D8]